MSGHYFFADEMEVGCVLNWTKSEHTGKCYRLFNWGKNWDDARSYCQNPGGGQPNGDLASVPDMETSQFLATLAGSNAWIGGKKGSDGEWKWSDGTPWAFEYWGSNQPSNTLGHNEDHMVLTNDDPNDPGRWKDTNGYGTVKKSFICQYVPGKEHIFFAN